jgi:glycosyltransferase involved in cell wall biosynthesis
MRSGKIIPMFDAVISYHLNAHTCGVARFNRDLARTLGVPLSGMREVDLRGLKHPIISIKKSEIVDTDGEQLLKVLKGPFSLILHSFEHSQFEVSLIERAYRVLALNEEIRGLVKSIRPDVRVGFAPGLSVLGNEFDVVELSLITFGMAHKIHPARYAKAGKLLERSGKTFRLEISSALHEGTQFDDSFFDVHEEIAGSFGGNVSFLGFLADAEVSRRLAAADAMLAFFPGGVRENNSSVIGAMNHGLAVITNLDSLSPEFFVHGITVLDIDQLEEFPPREVLRLVGRAGREAVRNYSFTHLVDRFLALEELD